MKEEPDRSQPSLSETMVARIEIKELGDPASERKMTDAILALDGVIEARIQKGALHVSYDPLATTEKKIEEAVRSTGNTIKTAATDTETARPDLPTSASAGKLLSRARTTTRIPDYQVNCRDFSSRRHPNSRALNERRIGQATRPQNGSEPKFYQKGN
jgi:hypothetical protein